MSLRRKIACVLVRSGHTHITFLFLHWHSAFGSAGNIAFSDFRLKMMIRIDDKTQASFAITMRHFCAKIKYPNKTIVNFKRMMWCSLILQPIWVCVHCSGQQPPQWFSSAHKRYAVQRLNFHYRISFGRGSFALSPLLFEIPSMWVLHSVRRSSSCVIFHMCVIWRKRKIRRKNNKCRYRKSPSAITHVDIVKRSETH